MPDDSPKCPKCKNILLERSDCYNPPLWNCPGCGSNFMNVPSQNPPKEDKPRWDKTYGEDADHRAKAEQKAEDATIEKHFSSVDGSEIPPETPAEYWNRLPPFVNEKYPESMWTRDRIVSSDGRPATIDPNKRFEEHSEADQKWITKEIMELTKDDEADMARGFDEAKRLSEERDNPKRYVVGEEAVDNIEIWWNNLSPEERLELTSFSHIADWKPDTFPKTSKEWGELTPREEDWIIQMATAYFEAQAEDFAMEQEMEARRNPPEIICKVCGYATDSEPKMYSHIEKHFNEREIGPDAFTDDDLPDILDKLFLEHTHGGNPPLRNSAFIVSNETIASIVTAIFGDEEYKTIFDNLIQAKDPLTLGQYMFNVNQKALYYRYEDKDDPPKYKHRSKQRYEIPQVVKSINCFHYQCSEGDTLEEHWLLFDCLERFASALKSDWLDGNSDWSKQYQDAHWDIPEKNPGNPQTTNWVREDAYYKTVVVFDPKDKLTAEATERAVLSVFPWEGVKVAPYDKTGLKGVEISVPAQFLPQDETQRKAKFVEFEKIIEKTREIIKPKDYIFQPSSTDKGGQSV